MKKLFLIVAIISLAATPTWAALIENGGFEKSIYPDTPTWDFKQLNYESTDITGWIVGPRFPSLCPKSGVELRYMVC
jgi:hypothetical protein